MDKGRTLEENVTNHSLARINRGSLSIKMLFFNKSMTDIFTEI
jgi:hypothetical protein